MAAMTATTNPFCFRFTLARATHSAQTGCRAPPMRTLGTRAGLNEKSCLQAQQFAMHCT